MFICGWNLIFQNFSGLFPCTFLALGASDFV